MTAAVLNPLVNCSSGGSGSSGNSGSSSNSGSTVSGNPAPSISSIAPQNATAGSAGLSLTVNGSGFATTSTISWNGVNLVTSGSGSQLTATVPASDLAAAGLAQVTVVNPASSGGTSNPVGFIVNGLPGFIYVAHSWFGSVLTGSISAFSVDPNTGSLTPVPGSPFPAGGFPSSLTSDPTGKFLYEVNDKNGASTNDLFAFAINPSTGALTSIPGSPFASGADTLSVSIDPTGKFLYTADSGGNNIYPSPATSISEFSINAATGALTLVSEAAACLPATADLANDIAIDPATGFLFDSGPLNGICSLSMSPSGTLQPVTGSPFAVNIPGQTLFPRSVAVDAFGKFLYTSNVSAFSITPGVGTLTQISGSPFLGFAISTFGISSVLADPLGRYLWAADHEAGIEALSINASTGALTAIPGLRVLSPNPYIAIIVTGPSAAPPMAADPSGKFLYVLTQPGPVAQNFTISGFAIDPTAQTLTPIPGSPLTLPANTPPVTLTITRKAQ